MKYAYLKPKKGDSPYYVHLTLDDEHHTMRVYYHMSWWKRETVDRSVFDYWIQGFKGILPQLKKSKRKHMKSGTNSIRVRGKCSVHRKMLKDIMGFVEKDTDQKIPAKLECYVNADSKMVEIEMQLPYSSLGAFPQEIEKLPVFTQDPDTETVKEKLLFFNLNYILGVKNTADTVTHSPELPPHHGSPDESEETKVRTTDTSIYGQEAQDERMADFRLDPAFAAGTHPYGSTMRSGNDDAVNAGDTGDASTNDANNDPHDDPINSNADGANGQD